MAKNPQYNDLVERFYQVKYTILVKKYFSKKVFDYIYPWVETLIYISWEISASYQLNLKSNPVQAVFVIEMIFKLSPVVYLMVVI